MFERGVKKGQVSIYVIIAIVIVAVVALVFLLRPSFNSDSVSPEFEESYNEFVFCLEENLLSGIRILESQGGYIYLPDFVSGSEYMPFSSQFDFLGNPIPYWYYVSGNNIPEEQVPTISFMESQLGEFVDSNSIGCVPENLLDTDIDVGSSDASVSIRSGEVQLNLDMDILFSKGDVSSQASTHRVVVESELRKLYEDAVEIYNFEQDELFLEEYGLDVVRLYAPVDGIELSCSPKVWNAQEIFEELQVAISENVKTLNTEGSEDDYFRVDVSLSSGSYARFLNSQDWPSTFEVNPSEGPILTAEPVGNQKGLGVLGFCYVPYHFVYDAKYSVLVQVYSQSTGEIFQFPFAVVIEDNQVRESLLGEAASYEGPEICENKNTEFSVRTIDSNSDLIDSEIYFECFSESCKIGDAENGVLDDLFPQCANGYLIAKADGFKDSEIQIQSVNSGSLDIIMDRLYEMDIQLVLDGATYNEEALVVFEGDSESKNLIYPEQREVNLSRGNYEISVYIYENVSLSLGASVQEYCIDVPRTFGFGTKEECFDVEVPEQLVSNALSGGGVQSYTISESDLTSGNEIVLEADSLPEPGSLNQLQENYVLFESKGLEVNFR